MARKTRRNQSHVRSIVPPLRPTQYQPRNKKGLIRQQGKRNLTRRIGFGNTYTYGYNQNNLNTKENRNYSRNLSAARGSTNSVTKPLFTNLRMSQNEAKRFANLHARHNNLDDLLNAINAQDNLNEDSKLKMTQRVFYLYGFNR